MNVNDNLTKLNFRFERGSKLLRTKLNKKLMKLNDEVTKMGGKTYIFFCSSSPTFKKMKLSVCFHNYELVHES